MIYLPFDSSDSDSYFGISFTCEETDMFPLLKDFEAKFASSSQ